MSAQPLARQYIRVGDLQVELPPGVSVSDWALERVRIQNPRIRSYLGCIRLLEQALESNYAILHCSPRRLLAIWRDVRRVCRLMQAELAPTLAQPSHIPELETARRNAELGFGSLASTVIKDVEAYPSRIQDDDLPAVRRLLCLSIGRIYSFLRDTFGEIVASDPRSLHDSDYYLSRRFPREIDEAEWLYASVDHLNRRLQGIVKMWRGPFARFSVLLDQEATVPSEAAWSEMASVLDLLTEGLTTHLQEVLTLSGIRFDEMEPIDHYAYDVPHDGHSLRDTYALARDTIGRLKARAGRSFDARRQSVEDLVECHAAFSVRMVELLRRIDRSLHDLSAYVPLWLDSIEKRRALMLTKSPGETFDESRERLPS